MTYHVMIVIIWFFGIFLNGRWRPSWILPVGKKRSKVTKVARQILKVDIVGYKNKS